MGFPGVTYPMVPGHEVVGRLVSKGKNVSEEFKEGKLVGLGWNGGYCTQCEACRKGEFYACVKHVVTGVTAPGGHQEYVSAHWSAVVNIPEETGLKPAEIAPLLCAGLTVNDALNAGHTKPGDVVIIQGVGGLGHLGIQLARKAGLHVIAVSGGDSKRDLALKLGAHEFYAAKDVDQITKKYGGAKLAVATAPSTEAINSLLPLTGRNGELIIVGIPHDGKKLEFDTMTLVGGRRSVKGLTCGCAINNEELINFAALGDNKVKSIVQTVKLDDAQAAYEDTINGNPKFRNVIVFDE